jgi:hypothetical protein
MGRSAIWVPSLLRSECSPSDEVVGLDLEEAGDHVSVYLHYDSQIVKVAIVGSCEDSD